MRPANAGLSINYYLLFTGECAISEGTGGNYNHGLVGPQEDECEAGLDLQLA
jgi:hypothetical protein